MYDNNCEELYTPQPPVTSRKLQRSTRTNLLQQNDSNNSLGILSLNSLDGSLSRESTEGRISNAHLQQQRMLAKSSLNKAAHKLSTLPPEFLKPSESILNSRNDLKCMNSESTIDEGDFDPSEVSTPRVSKSINSNEVKNTEQVVSDSRILADISQKLRLSNINDNVSELFGLSQAKMSNCKESNVSLSFIPADLVAEKLMADELSWRNEKDILGRCSEYFEENSLCSMLSRDKVSMGEYFIQKSQDLKTIIPNKSPEKENVPVPLIDCSNTSAFNDTNALLDCNKKDSLSISTIAKIVANMDVNETPSKIVQYLLKQGENILETNKEERNKNSEDQFKLSPSFNARNLNDPNVSKCLTISSNESSSGESTKASTVKSYNASKIEHDIKDTASETTEKNLHSVRSASSLSNLPNGRLPIESNRTELIWGCVKIGKKQTQEFVLRNRSQYRVKLQASITGSCFKILDKDHGETEVVSSIRIMLHTMETRTITVVFSPTSVGAAIEKIIFTPLDKKMEQTKCQLIKLFGYGGNANVEIINLVKDTTGKFWLSLGKVENKNETNQSFIIRNSGILPAFVSMTVEFKKPYSFTNVALSSNDFILSPREKRKINIIYVPTKDDIKYLHNNLNASVIEIASIKLISGAEVTRGRIRRLWKKVEEKNLGDHYMHKNICKYFDGELMPADLSRFKETISSMKEVCQHLDFDEIVLTLEQDPDGTLVNSIDETTMFQTLCPDSSNITVLEKSACKPDNFSVVLDPTRLVLTPPVKTQDTLLLNSNSYHAVKFNVFVPYEGLIVSPKEGIILPGETFLIQVSYKGSDIKQSQVYKLSFYIENDLVEVIVKIVPVNKTDDILVTS